MCDRVLHPGQLRFHPRRQPVLPSGVECQLGGAPVTLTVGRIGEDDVGGEVGEGIGLQAVAQADVGLEPGFRRYRQPRPFHLHR
ncbi:Uncharacterised protein [Mycobacteroides abscessus subsp. abscessus]|nr:Uncharacterised protein [Mycobacteroides abscessus subsp. abscessus]